MFGVSSCLVWRKFQISFERKHYKNSNLNINLFKHGRCRRKSKHSDSRPFYIFFCTYNVFDLIRCFRYFRFPNFWSIPIEDLTDGMSLILHTVSYLQFTGCMRLVWVMRCECFLSKCREMRQSQSHEINAWIDAISFDDLFNHLSSELTCVLEKFTCSQLARFFFCQSSASSNSKADSKCNKFRQHFDIFYWFIAE